MRRGEDDNEVAMLCDVAMSTVRVWRLTWVTIPDLEKENAELKRTIQELKVLEKKSSQSLKEENIHLRARLLRYEDV